METVRKTIRRRINVRHDLLREAFAEFIGTAFLIVLGDGSVAQSVLSNGSKGGFLTINFAWGFAVVFAVYISGGVTGGHINPAISLGNFILGNINAIRLLVYSVAQTFGAFVGAAIVYLTYYEAFDAYDGGVRSVVGLKATAGIFATYPQDYLGAFGGFVDQVVGTAILAMCVLAITDGRNMNVPGFLVPTLVGLVVTMIGMTYGFNCGYAINPARDLGPRLFTLIGGWGGEVFSFRNYNWFWVPLLGPCVGALVGAWIYKLLIGLHWFEQSQNEADHKEPGADENLLLTTVAS